MAGPTHPFKKVMSGGANDSKGKLPAAKLPETGAAKKTVATHQPLPGGVKPKAVAAQTLKPVTASASSTRETARAHANAKADNLVELRQHAVKQSTQRYDTRLVDLICQELKIEFGNPPAAPRAAAQPANSDRSMPEQRVEREPQPLAVSAPAEQLATVTPITQPAAQVAAKREADVKAASAVELIEKIEAFVKSQRPGLAITLDGSLGARVEIERLGPKEVAIRLVGKNGPPAPEDVGRIREEMRARGLKVGALSVA